MKKWLFNPFVYVAGARALILGWAVILITASIAYYSRTHFDGVIDAHTGCITPLAVYFIEPLIDWTCPTVLLYLGGIIFSKSAIRFIDVAGTMALARWPMIFFAIIGFGINLPSGINAHTDINTLLKSITGTIIVLGLVGFVFIIWMIALMYNAFSVSCNMKGGKAAGVFIGGLVVAEIISKVTIYLLYKNII